MEIKRKNINKVIITMILLSLLISLNGYAYPTDQISVNEEPMSDNYISEEPIDILGILGLVIPSIFSIIALVIACFANKRSKNANDIAEGANDIAEGANDIAEKANRISIQANDIAEEALKIAKQTVDVAEDANDISKRGQRNADRPDFKIKSWVLDPKKIDIYIGENVELDNAKPLVGVDPTTKEEYDYENIVLGTCRKLTLLSYNEKEHMLVNLCPHDIKKYIDNAVIAFGVLSMTIDFDTSKISELVIEKTYSMMSETDSFYRDIKIDIDLPIHTSPLEIPMAFACLNGRDSPIHLPSINKLVTSENLKDKEPINFLGDLDSRSKASRYLNFIETAYLFRYKNMNGDIYYHSIFLEMDVDNEKVLKGLRRLDDCSLFREKAEKACEKAGHDVVSIYPTS